MERQPTVSLSGVPESVDAERWKKPRGRRQTPPATLAIVHRMLAADYGNRAAIMRSQHHPLERLEHRRKHQIGMAGEYLPTQEKNSFNAAGYPREDSLGDGGGRCRSNPYKYYPK